MAVRKTASGRTVISDRELIRECLQERPPQEQIAVLHWLQARVELDVREGQRAAEAVGAFLTGASA